MFSQFPVRYPTTSLISELVTISSGNYVVKASVLIEGVIRATGLAAADTIEQAEDRARKRALEVLGIANLTPAQPEVVESSLAVSEALGQPQPDRTREVAFSPQPRELPNYSRIFTDTTLLNNTFKSDIPDLTMPSVAVDEFGIAAPLSPDGQRHVLEENPTEVSFSTLDPEKEANVAPCKKVTPIRSRRQDLDQSLVQPLPSFTETQDSFDQIAASTDFVDISDELAQIKSELKRLNWSEDQKNEFLERTYNKPSLLLLDKEEVLDFLQYLASFAQIDVELKRIGWSKEKGRAHLIQNYKKRSRYELSPKELGQFLQHLELQPSPT